MDIADFNQRWLRQWTLKSVEGVMEFYHPDVTYFDENVAAGLQGAAALQAYLPQMFATIDECIYHPSAVWPIEGGFCGRWTMDLRMNGVTVRLRGFDLVELKDDLIVHNEVYTHRLVEAG